MCRASLCPSSGEQRPCYCIWCVVLVLLDVVGSGCGALCYRMRAMIASSASNRNEYQEFFLGVKSGRCVRLIILPPSCAIVTKSGNLNFLEPSGHLGSVVALIYLFMTFTCVWRWELCGINPLTPNDHYSGRTAPLTSKRCILYIYSTNIDTEYFKHGIYTLFFSLQNAVCFIILTYLLPVLFTFYIQCVLKLKNNNSGAKRLILP